MPIIPKYESSAKLPSGGQGPRGSIAAAGVAGRALQRLGDTISGVDDVHKRFEQARQANDLANYSSDATLQLGLLEQEQEQSGSPDIEVFEKKAEELREKYRGQIEDSAVWKAFEKDFNRTLIEKNLSVRNTQRKVFVEKSKGNLDANLETYRQAHLNAKAPEEKALVMNQARVAIAGRVAAGIIGADDGVNLEQKFLGNVEIDEVRARGLLNPEQVAKDVLDTEKYPSIPEDKRLTLHEQLIRRAEANERESVRKQEKTERDVERALKKSQAGSEAEMWGRVSGLTEVEVLERISDQTISDEGGRSLLSEIRREESEGNSNEYAGHIEDLLDGTPGTVDRIKKSAGLSGDQKARLLSRADSLADKTQQRRIGRAKETLKSFIITEFGLMGQFVRADENQDYQMALNELEVKIFDEKKKVFVALDEVLTERGSLKPPEPPVLNFGDIDNLENAKSALVDAYKTQVITEQEYRVQALKIDEYEKQTFKYKKNIELMKRLREASRNER